MSVNTVHKVTLTEGQIGVILCSLEKSVKYADSEYVAEVDTIFEELEGVVDNYYDVRSCITNGEDYADCVDKLVESMEEN